MFEKYNQMSNKQMQENFNLLIDKRNNLLQEEKRIDRKIRKNLWLWYLFPFFGLFFYQIHLKKRREKDENYFQIKAKKEDIIYLEIEIEYLKKKLALK